MMWSGSDEPLYEENILGEDVSFYWCQADGKHRVRAVWSPEGKKANPWDTIVCEGESARRHLAIAEATGKISKVITDHHAKIKNLA